MLFQNWSLSSIQGDQDQKTSPDSVCAVLYNPYEHILTPICFNKAEKRKYWLSAPTSKYHLEGMELEENIQEFKVANISSFHNNKAHSAQGTDG